MILHRSNRAEELEQRLQGVEEGMLSAFGGVEFGSMIYGSYNYNFNSPSKPQDNNLRVFDPRANTFNMDLLQLTIAKETDSGVGFAAVIDYGKTAGLIQSDWNGDGDLSNGTDNFALQEAYLTYTLNAGNGLDMRFGKFVTLLGAEVIEAPLNPNVSRSFLFGFAIPFTPRGC